MISIRPRRIWPLAIPVALATSYALFQGVFEAQTGSGDIATEAIMSLLNDGRVQTFIVLPAWLIGAAYAIHRGRAPERLVRVGSWRRTVGCQLLHCLALFGLASAGTLIGWFGILTLFGGWGRVVDALAACAGEVVLLGAVLVAMYLLMSILHFAVGRVLGLVIAPIGLWSWAALSNIGVTYGSQFDLGRYLSILAVLHAPSLLLVLLGVLLALGACVWLVASEKDDIESSGGRRLPSASLVAEWAGASLVIVAAIVMAGGDGTSTGGLTTIFFGAGGTVLQYLLGSSVVLTAGISAVLRFSREWERRAHLVIRHGSVARWLGDCLVRFAVRAALYLAGTMIVVVAIRAVRFGQVVTSWDDLQAAIHLYGLLVGTAFVLISVGIACVLTTGSGVAGWAGQAALVTLGLIPTGDVVANPMAAWSMSWWHLAGVQTAASISVALGVCLILLVVVSAERRTW